MRNYQTRVIEKLETHILSPMTFFFENRVMI